MKKYVLTLWAALFAASMALADTALSPSWDCWTEPGTGNEWYYESTPGGTTIMSVTQASGTLIVPEDFWFAPVALGDRAFAGLGVSTVIVPVKIETLGTNVFVNCTQLSRIDFEGTPPSGLADAGIPAGTLVRYNDEYEEEWQAALVSAGLTNVSSYHPILGIDWEYGYCDDGVRITGLGFGGLGNVPGEVRIPQSHMGKPVTEIGNEWFVSLFDWFDGAELVTAMTIPGGVRRIRDGVFEYCTALKSVDLPDSLVSIGMQAFMGCSELTDLTLPRQLQSIGSHAFQGCDGLSVIDMPSTVTNFGLGALNGCRNLTNINVSADNPCYRSIGGVLYDKAAKTLVQCPGGTTAIELPTTVETIASQAFFRCEKLRSVHLPASVRDVGEGVFICCYSLTSLTVDTRNRNYSSRDGVLYDYAKQTLVVCPCAIASVDIPSTVTRIANCGFTCCTNLTEVQLPDGLREIGEDAFDECLSLVSITLPRGVSNIPAWAFFGCDRLEAVEFLGAVTNVGSYAFYRCESLPSLTLPYSVQTIGAHAFRGCSSLELWFEGPPPECDDETFSIWSGADADCVCGYYRTCGNLWKAEIDADGKWHGLSMYSLSESEPGTAAFESGEATAAKGGAFVLTVVGGNDESAASVKVNVSYGSAKATDLVLKSATVMGGDGVEQTNLKFPLTLNWKAGDSEPKVITIPVAAGKATDAPKFLVWNLSDAKGLELGETPCCIGRIEAGGSYNGDDVYVLPYVTDVSGGKVTGGASVKIDKQGNYKAVTLKATANKGYWFAGWYNAWGNWVSGDLSYKLTPCGSDLEAVEARFVPEKPSLCATYNGYARVNLKGMTLVKGAKTEEDVIGEYPLTATLSAAGKLSGSITVGGKKVAFAADGCYDASEDGSWVTYRFNVDEKAWFGVSNVETLQLEISRWKDEDGRFEEYGVARLGGVSAEGAYAPLGDEQSGFAYRLAGKEDLGLLKPFVGTYAVAISADGGVIPLSVSIDASGKVKASGKYFDGTAVSATGTMSYRYCWETGSMPEDVTEEAALVSLFFSPKALGSGIVHVLFRCSHYQGEGYCCPDVFCTVTEYTADSVGAMDECDWNASPYATGCWVPTYPELADPDYGAVRLTSEDDVIDILYVSKNGVITGLGSATMSGVTVKFDPKTGLFTVAKGKEYTIQGILGDYEWDCYAAGRINADGSHAYVDVEFVTLPKPEENFPWTDDGFVLTLGQNFGEEMQPSVTSAEAPLELTITGLPSGLKFDKTTGLITGAPTKSGTSTVKVSYKYGSRTIARETTLVVSAKPEGLPMGTYVGYAEVERDDGVSESYVDTVRCPLTVTIDKNGALTGSITLFGKKTTLKAAGYDAFEDGRATYDKVTLDLRAVDKTWDTATVALSIGENDLDGWDEGLFGDDRALWLMAYRDQSKDADFASWVAPYIGNYVAALTTRVDVNEDDQVGVTAVSVTIDKKGTAKVAGTYVDGSAFSATATVIPHEEGYSKWAQIIVLPTVKSLAQGSLYLSFELTEQENEWTRETEIEVWCDAQAAKYVFASGEYVQANLDQNYAYAYSSLEWVDWSVDPASTCLWVGCDNDVFAGSYFAWKTKVRSCGPEIIGVDKQLSGPKMTFKLDDKTGLFSGSSGTYKIFGVMEKGTCSGVGTIIDKDGSIDTVLVGPTYW